MGRGNEGERKEKETNKKTNLRKGFFYRLITTTIIIIINRNGFDESIYK